MVLMKRDMSKWIPISSALVFLAGVFFLTTGSTPHAIAVALPRYEANNSAVLTVSNVSPKTLVIWRPRIEVKAGNVWTNYSSVENLLCDLTGPTWSGDETLKRCWLPDGNFVWRARINYEVLETTAWKVKVNYWLNKADLPIVFSRKPRELITTEYCPVGLQLKRVQPSDDWLSISALRSLDGLPSR
jgi:hypothetical protein